MLLSGQKTIGTSISLRKETTRSLHKSNPRRPIRTSATVVADIRIDRRRCTYRPSRMRVSVVTNGFTRLFSPTSQCRPAATSQRTRRCRVA